MGCEWKCVGVRRKSRDQDFSVGTEREGGVLWRWRISRMRFWERGKVVVKVGGGRGGVGMGWKETEGIVRSSRSSLMVKEACREG